MSELLKKQLFGVEIEFTGISRATAAKLVAEKLSSTVVGSASDAYYTRKLKDSQGRIWKVMRDSSIRPAKKSEDEDMDEYRVEFVTPPLNYEDIELLQAIVRKFKDAGAVVNSSCGIHVHVDGVNHSAKTLRRLVDFIVARQNLIYEALNIGDRKNRWCKPLNKKILAEMKKAKNLTNEDAEKIWYSEANDNYYGGINHGHYNETRYHGINLHSFFSKGTVEFRLFNSTLHAGKIKAYIQFCLALSAWAIESGDNISFRNISNYTADKKVTIMRNILINRLGLSGDEFKTCRLHLMTPLKENAQRVAA
mgnify:CR=1 FL=1